MSDDHGQLTGRSKVFVSYSRAEAGFADQIVLFLEEKGFEPIIDRHNIEATGEWEAQLGALILSCDTVVFVLTPNSAASERCAWEAREAARLNKRIIPIVPGPLNQAAPPPELSKIQYIFFFEEPTIPGSGFVVGLRTLDRSLRLDLDWLRQQTKLTELAADWAIAKPDDRLLRGVALDEALTWRGATPADATIPAQVLEFINASDLGETRRKAEAQAALAERETALKAAADAVTERETALEQKSRAEARLRRFAILAVVGACVLTIMSLIGFGFAARQTAKAADNRAQIFAALSETLAKEGRGADALLMAVHADPASNRDPIVRLQRPNGLASALNALAFASSVDRENNRFTGHEGQVSAVAFSPDGRRILTGSDDKTARLWDAETGKTLKVLSGHKGWVTSVAFSPDGRRILTGSIDKSARLWDAETGKALKAFSGHESNVLAVAFSPDGKRILTGYYDSTARLWDADTGQALRVFSGHEDWVTSVAFSPDGLRILTGSADKTARLWALPPILFATPNEKVRMACKALSQMAFTSFTDAERNKYPILADEPKEPCKAFEY